MAKVIRCSDVGVDCDFTARGENVEEVMSVLEKHARDEHDMQQIPAETVAKIKSAIRDE